MFGIPGNDVEGDSDSPAAPVKTVEKTSTHTVKRNADGNAPAKASAVSGGRRGGAVSGNEAGILHWSQLGDLLADKLQLSATVTPATIATVVSPLMRLVAMALGADMVPAAAAVSLHPVSGRSPVH